MKLAEIHAAYQIHSFLVLVWMHEDLGPGLELPVMILLFQRLPTLFQGCPVGKRVVELLWMPAELNDMNAFRAAIGL